MSTPKYDLVRFLIGKHQVRALATVVRPGKPGRDFIGIGSDQTEAKADLDQQIRNFYPSLSNGYDQSVCVPK